MKPTMLLKLALAGLFAATQAAAALIEITGNTADRETYTGPGWPGGLNGATVRVGAGGSAPHLERAAVFVFQLPIDILAADITSVSFSNTLVSHAGTGWTFSFDLYALDARASSTVLASDHYAGGNDTRSGVHLIQQDFATNASLANSVLSTDSAGSISLTSFIQAQLNAGKGGQYIFLRINPDTSPTSGGLNFATADNTTLNMVLPTLTISTIPEPSAAAGLAGAAVLLQVAVRRRRSAR